MKIAILGSAPSSRMLAPFNDPNWEVWACSPPNYDLPRVDAWFELHNLDRKLANVANKPYFDVLAQHSRVYIAKADPRLPNAVEFPFRPLIDKYGRDFWASSLSWMFAFAIEQKPEKIGVWGVDLAAHEEYSSQRPSFKFFIREAKKLGIGIYAPPQSDILMPMPLYALKEQSPMWAKQKARKAELQSRFNTAQAQKDKAEKEMLIFQGALDDMQYIENTYCPAAFMDGLNGEDAK